MCLRMVMQKRPNDAKAQEWCLKPFLRGYTRTIELKFLPAETSRERLCACMLNDVV